MKKALLLSYTCAALSVIALAESASPPAIRSLGKPCLARQVLAGLIVNDRRDGRERFVITNASEATHVELIFIDFAQDTAEVFTAPAGSGSWALREVPGDRLVVGTYYDGHFMVFDLKSMSFTQDVAFPGESYVWNLAMGKDGRIYGGTYDGGKLGALDLSTHGVEDCGAPAPPNLYLRQVSALPDGRILCSLGMNAPALKIYDPATKSFSPAPESLAGIATGVAWNGCFVAGTRAFDGTALSPMDTPPFPVPPAEGGAWTVETLLSTENHLVLRQGTSLFCIEPEAATPARLCSLDFRGGTSYAVSKDKRVLGVRGQDYFAAAPDDTQLNLKPIPGAATPRPILFLRAGPDNSLWGGPHFGQTVFRMNPGTGDLLNTGAVCDSGGEVYDVAFLGGKVYAAAYAGGDIVEYDPAAPWDQWNKTNPRPVARMNGQGRGYIRPTGGIVAGPEGRLYSGWMTRYGAYGGAVARTDPASGATELMENPLGEQAVSAFCLGGDQLYVGTTLTGNGLPQKAGEAPRFGAFASFGAAPEFQQEFPGAASVSRLYFDLGTNRVVMAVGGVLHTYVPGSTAVAPLAIEGLPAVNSAALAGRGDGLVWYGNGTRLVRLDLAQGVWTAAADCGCQIENVVMAGENRFWVSCGAEVLEIVLPETAERGQS